MSITKKQLTANRQNAQKSTGPKTAEGKAASSQNHLKHGLYSGNVIINSPYLQENQADYDALVDSLIAELHPEGMLQNLLVRKIANCFWRFRRVINAETANIQDRLGDLDSNPTYLAASRHRRASKNSDCSCEAENMVSMKSIPDDFSSKHMLRYEMRFDRQLGRAFRLLAQLKREARLMGEIVPNSGVPENEHSNPISDNPNADSQLYENQETGHHGDSIKVPPAPPRHLPDNSGQALRLRLGSATGTPAAHLQKNNTTPQNEPINGMRPHDELRDDIKSPPDAT
jgi:hypothetical protein